jgi:hypothetical protein
MSSSISATDPQKRSAPTDESSSSSFTRPSKKIALHDNNMVISSVKFSARFIPPDPVMAPYQWKPPASSGVNPAVQQWNGFETFSRMMRSLTKERYTLWWNQFGIQPSWNDTFGLVPYRFGNDDLVGFVSRQFMHHTDQRLQLSWQLKTKIAGLEYGKHNSRVLGCILCFKGPSNH